MNTTSLIVAVVGLVVGGVVAFVMCRNLFVAQLAESNATLTAETKAAATRGSESRAQIDRLEQELRAKDLELRRFESDTSALRAEAAAFQARMTDLNSVHDRMRETFAVLSAEALKSSSDSFFQIAQRELNGVRAETLRDLGDKEKAIDSLLSPIREGLLKYDAKVDKIARERDEAFGALTNQLQRIEHANVQLGRQTEQLSRAMRSPAARGQWGELQLRRVMEISGMLEHCDFDSQPTVGEDGSRLRPDVIIRLPGNRTVVIDSKVPLSSYLDAVDEPDEGARKLKLKAHSAQLRAHSDALGRKGYWQHVGDSPEFVVLFLPSEVFFSAALEHDPLLIEDSFTRNRVVIATPTTLIALLQAVAYGWRQESIARSAQEIAELGRELYERLSKFDDHIGNVGDHLEKAMKFYNSAVGALESRVLVSARRFKDLGVTSSVGELTILEPLEMPVRALRSAELTDGMVES